jgi:hypothetical protein
MSARGRQQVGSVMETRLIIGYGLMAFLVMAAAGSILLWRRRVRADRLRRWGTVDPNAIRKRA